jgi:hypothetical protein
VPSFTNETDLAINGVPSGASAACSAATKPDPNAGYSLSNARVVGRGEDAELVFDVTWRTDQSPSYQDCQAVFSFTDGQVVSYDFGIEVPNNSTARILLPAELADAEPASVTCERV